MAKKAKRRRYSRSSQKDVKSEMHRYKRGTAEERSGWQRRGKVREAVNKRSQSVFPKARKKGQEGPEEEES